MHFWKTELEIVGFSRFCSAQTTVYPRMEYKTENGIYRLRPRDESVARRLWSNVRSGCAELDRHFFEMLVGGAMSQLKRQQTLEIMTDV